MLSVLDCFLYAFGISCGIMIPLGVMMTLVTWWTRL